jgi:hypothetical protein
MVTGRLAAHDPCMIAGIVIEAPLRLEPVSSDPFIADLEPRSRDAQGRASEPVERAAVAPRRPVND